MHHNKLFMMHLHMHFYQLYLHLKLWYCSLFVCLQSAYRIHWSNCVKGKRPYWNMFARCHSLGGVCRVCVCALYGCRTLILIISANHKICQTLIQHNNLFKFYFIIRLATLSHNFRLCWVVIHAKLHCGDRRTSKNGNNTTKVKIPCLVQSVDDVDGYDATVCSDSLL